MLNPIKDILLKAGNLFLGVIFNEAAPLLDSPSSEDLRAQEDGTTCQVFANRRHEKQIDRTEEEETPVLVISIDDLFYG